MTGRPEIPQQESMRAEREPAPPLSSFDLSATAARAAALSDAAPPRPWPSDDLGFIAAVLESHEVPPSLVGRILERVAAARGAAPLAERIAAALGQEIRFIPLGELLRLPALLLVGPAGAGKTTLAAKLAARIGEDRAMLVNADAANESGSARLEECSDVLGLRLQTAAEAEALSDIVARAAPGLTLIIDTPALAADESGGDGALAALIAASGAHPVLVLPADIAVAEISGILRRAAPLGARALLPSRLDLARRLGAVLAAADGARMTLPAAGFTPHVAYGLRPLTPAMLSRRLLQAALEQERGAPAAR